MTGRKALLKKIELINGYINQIEVDQVGAEKKTDGVTKSKKDAGDIAIEMALDFAARAFVYAEDNDKHVLQAQFNVSKNYFSKTQGVLTVSRIKDLIFNLNDILKDLNGYDVTSVEVSQLQTAMSRFNAQLANPRGVTVDRKNKNDNVKASIALLKKTMKATDKLMTKLKGTELFKEYKIARKVIDLGTRKSQGRRKKKDDKNKPTDMPDGKAPTAA